MSLLSFVKLIRLSGTDPGFTKEGAQIHCNEHDNCVNSARSGMQSMPNLGGSGGMPPGNFEKLDPLRLNLRALLMICYFYYSKTACTLQNN